MGGLIDRPRAIKRAERTELTNVTNIFGKPDKYILQSRQMHLLQICGLILINGMQSSALPRTAKCIKYTAAQNFGLCEIVC